MAADHSGDTVVAPPRPADAAVSERRRSTPYVPALDGLRGLAVAAVLCFHGGFSWATGGFLGVSTFFTLSGFLITTLLLTEHERHGRVGLRGFWSRRFRRLMPASLLCLAGVVVFGAVVATSAQLDERVKAASDELGRLRQAREALLASAQRVDGAAADVVCQL